MTTREPAILLLKEGTSDCTQWFFDKDEIILGREPDCHVILNDRQVSRHHARIRCQGKEYILEDLDSTNGTFIRKAGEDDRRPVKGPVVLDNRDEITIAFSFCLEFVPPGVTTPGLHPILGLRLDPEAKRVWVNGQELDPPLSLAQYHFLALLYEKPGSVHSREEIVQAVWPDDEAEGVSEQAIDALARRLRERLAEIDPDTQYIVTMRGYGFRLDHAIP
jgi:hypothetical protein